ncbi:hypothetical protein C8J30_10747 [Rhodobacter viridis]|uniref:Uncharacterized protein n=1 Tax=Rhodobacter viridis TaxID=1054202 RepID=A0A318TY38_9RHOB|nr:hypothetical protein [Rhodobacter viridis]PYF09677.1 hypothetical protein C8J30_10747 [Rhodobacter viridis]
MPEFSFWSGAVAARAVAGSVQIQALHGAIMVYRAHGAEGMDAAGRRMDLDAIDAAFAALTLRDRADINDLETTLRGEVAAERRQLANPAAVLTSRPMCCAAVTAVPAEAAGPAASGADAALETLAES